MPAQPRRSAPTVVFADQVRWGVFTQVAAAVRRSGGRAVRITIEGQDWRNRLIDALAYSRSIYLDGPESLATVAGLLADEDVVDVQCSEYVCGPLAAGDATTLPGTAGSLVALRGALLDKFTVGELAADRGVRTPAKLAADRVSVDDAIAALGLPIVVKARVGASGDNVRIVQTAAEAERALAEVSPDRGDVFFEQMVVGEDVGYQAVVGTGGLVMDCATSVVARSESTIPPARTQVIDAPDLLEFGRHASEKLGLTGILQMDIVRDAEGRYWLLDLNARPWGTMFALRAAGVDFAAAYLYTIGLRSEQPPPPVVRTDMTMAVFPRVVDDEIRQGRPLGGVRAFLKHSFRYLRWLGFRYWLCQLLIALGSLRTSVFRSA